MVDETHRTQEGDMGRKMREALPNAFLFGFIGTPIMLFSAGSLLSSDQWQSLCSFSRKMS